MIQKGFVRWFDPVQGHGFIDPEDGGPAVFVHRDALAPELGGALQEAQHVAYEIETTPAGDAARQVRPVTATGISDT
jgi:cold shock CspA family protein